MAGLPQDKNCLRPRLPRLIGPPGIDNNANLQRIAYLSHLSPRTKWPLYQFCNRSAASVGGLEAADCGVRPDCLKRHDL